MTSRLLFSKSKIAFGAIGAVAGLGTVLATSSIIHLESPQKSDLVLETHSKTFFPTEWTTSSSLQRLVGTGVRAVTFLQFHAYSMGFYVSPETARRLQSSSRWIQEFSAGKWSDKNAESREFFLKDLLKEPSEMMILITPVRPTDGVHLRNGFIKMLETRFQKENPTISAEDRANIQDALDKFKAFFPSKTVAKGSRLSFELRSDGMMSCAIACTEMGVVENKKVASWFFQGYLLGDNISPSFVRSVGVGLERLLDSTAK